MRVVHSVLHPDDLSELVEREYAITAPVSVTLLSSGFNDHYRVVDAHGRRHVLRVYVREKYWVTSQSDLCFELELLDFLAAGGHLVSHPYRRRNGELIGRLAAPEGERCFALLTYVPGPPGYDGTGNAEQWRAFGTGLARMHQAMDRFTSDHHRYHLDERILVDMFLTGIKPYVGAEGAAAYKELTTIGDRLRAELAALRAIPGTAGLIHADIHRGNIRSDDQGRFVLFDFDHCGFGLRAYELASLYRGPEATKEDREQWAAILAGYQEVRTLSQDELSAFPSLAACRALWDVGDWLRVVDRTGDDWASERLCRDVLDRVTKVLG